MFYSICTMAFGKKKILAVFLEKDNLKFLLYSGAVRTFAGQITFSPEVVRDGFIADAEKFSSQVKVAFAQKITLHEAPEVILFVSPDKTFTKTLPSTDSIDSFIHGLPYFKEELVINSTLNKDKTTTYVAFEKKLIEDLQRPFFDMGKKILAVKSAANVITARFPQVGKNLMLIPLDKDVVAVITENGAICDLSVIRNEVFAARFPEFKSAHEINSSRVFTVGVFPSNLAANLNLQLVSLAQTDIYDLIFNSSMQKNSKFKLPELNINSKYLFLAGAILIGGLLVFVIVKNFPKQNTKVVSPVVVTPTPTPIPEPKPADYPVAILNGTLVGGEAGRLAESLKALGFPITETKNATSAGFVATRLRSTKDVPTKILVDIKTSLLNNYESVNLESLATMSGKAVIEIIIGKKK